jgi:hypothetical protein
MMGRFAKPLVAMLAILVARAALAQGFYAVQPPPAPDYTQAQSWAARSGQPDATVAKRDSEVDIFYVHPTTFRSADAWNQPIGDMATNAWTDASAIARQASIFKDCCRIYAPRYRQAASRAVGQLDGDGGKAFALAYGDVERAFDFYLAHYNRGHPFILVGHSQGAAHIATLLERRIDSRPIARQMVAAYVIGFNLSRGEFGKSYKSLVPCDRPAQIGCVVGWNSVMPDLDRAVLRPAMEKRYVARHGDGSGDESDSRLLCINPLTFDHIHPVAGKSRALGAAPGDPGAGPLLPTVPRAVAARCIDGFLVVDPDPSLALKPLPGGSMHFHDMGLFYADIRANAVRRIATYRKANAQ